MAALEATLARRAPARLTIAGIAAGIVGVAILVAPWQGASNLDPVGVGLCLAAALTWTTGSVYSQRAPLPGSPFLAAGQQMLLGGIVLLVVGIGRGELATFTPGTVSLESLLGLAYLIGFGSLAALSAYTWLLGHAPTSLISTYAYVNPMVAVALGTVLLAEPITPRTLVAFGVILVAVVAMVSGRPRTATTASRRLPEPEPAA